MTYQRLQIHQNIADELIRYLDGGVKLSNTLYKARCPVCRDKVKQRLFIYNKRGKNPDDATVMKCYCHNCNASNKICSGAWITTFVRELYPSIYERHMEEFTEAPTSKDNVETINEVLKRNSGQDVMKLMDMAMNSPETESTSDEKPVVKSRYPEKIFDMIRLDLVMNHNPEHPIVKYVLNRSLPIEEYDRLYVTNDYKTSMEFIPAFVDNVKKLYSGTQALLIPMFDENMKIKGIQSRFMSKTFRFLTLMMPDQDKLFGTETLDPSKDHYVLEAPLDSLHVSNSIATLDSNLTKSDVLGDNFIFVYDNQPRNKEICKAMYNTIESGSRIVIFDSSNIEKDINDMVKNGLIKNDDMNAYLEKNTYQGDYALDKFYEWKKIAL